MLHVLDGAVSAGAGARAAATGLTGLAVALVVLQSSGGFAVELLGPDVLLTVTGFALTLWLLGAGPGAGLRRYYATLLARLPLLVVTVAVVLGVTAWAVPCRLDGPGAVAAMLAAANWWQLLAPGPLACPVPGALVAVDPLGAMWLVAVLVQLCLLWPPVLAAGHALVRRLRRGRTVVAAVLVALAVAGTAAVGPLRVVQGAGPAELALGTHVRLAEFVVGAAAAVLVAGLHRRGDADGSRGTGAAVALTVTGLALLGASGVAAWLEPPDWLRLGGPLSAALGTAVVLLGVTSVPNGPLARAVGRGLPVELGRSAPALLVLHLPVFWLLQLAVPPARPFALTVVGGVLAWLAGLLLHDGVLRRALRGRRRLVAWGAVALVAAGVVVGGPQVAVASAPPTGPGGVLVVGGARAAGAAAALRAAPRPVVDATVPGCGLRDDGAAPSPARTTAGAQLADGAAAAECAGWAERWARAVADGAPVAVVVDLSDDAAARPPGAGPGPCEASFRPDYRERLDRAAAVWTAGAPDRPVLVVLPDPADPAGRCLGALVGAAVARHPALVAVPGPDAAAAAVDAQLAPEAVQARRAGAAAACRSGPAEVVRAGC